MPVLSPADIQGGRTATAMGPLRPVKGGSRMARKPGQPLPDLPVRSCSSLSFAVAARRSGVCQGAMAAGAAGSHRRDQRIADAVVSSERCASQTRTTPTTMTATAANSSSNPSPTEALV